MKKLVCIALVLLFCLPSSAMADVLTDGWESATLEELQAAQHEISARIVELQAAVSDEASTLEKVELSGNGTSILTDVVIPFSPSRVILTSDDNCSAKLTGGIYDQTFESNDYEEAFFDQQGTFSLLVETAGAWTFTVEPIAYGDSLPMEGVGPFVSDFIELNAPMIVTITCDASKMDAMLTNMIVKKHYDSKYSDIWGADSLTNELLTASDAPFSADLILQPEVDQTQYCISVICEPGVEWSITPKV